MEIEIAFLRSKVARRIFTLFIISSLIPVILLMLLAFRQVNNLISTQQHEQLRQTNKQYGITVFERLLLLKKTNKLDCPKSCPRGFIGSLDRKPSI